MSRKSFAAGLHSETIGELLPCIHDLDGTPNALATPFLVERLTEELARIDQAMHDRRRTSDMLDGIIQAAGGEAPEQ
ncbi:hypothetical protein OHB12_27830 [Nocardia sp. NBC_01730]|uniref:hypothetical protein n=1 Tax=Nocardia sp. NBC_01730 TaxID=2975998 RepID=UPI002E0EF990|nr:hypothetical protein OHB12_27830 [Nocardia sp. NBC_01730]